MDRSGQMEHRHHHEQGLSPRRVGVEELFHPSSLEVYKI